MVQPSWVHTASIAENALSLVRASRYTPATDSTRTAPPTLANADPLTVTLTLFAVNWPAAFASGVAGLPVDEGEEDEPLQPLKIVASAAAAVPAQNWRREIEGSVSDIALILIGRSTARRISGARSDPREKSSVLRLSLSLRASA